MTKPPPLVATALLAWVLVAWVLAWPLAAGAADPSAPEVRIGSKKFTEAVVLGEIALHLSRNAKAGAVHLR